MKNWKQYPKYESLSNYVECYWFLEKESLDSGNNYPKLNPDPSAHLIIASDNCVNSYAYDEVSERVQGSHWIYPHLKTLTMDHSSPFSIIGIKFKVGALYSLRFGNLDSCLNHIAPVGIESPFSKVLLNAEKLLKNAFTQKDHVCNVLDEALHSWMLKNLEDKHSALVRQILPLLSNNAITGIGERLHRSQRTVERSFTKVTGMTMKQVHSMNRLEEILNYLYQLNEGDINWADIASRYDFSDQPHLIRHLKNSIGRTPAEYVQQRDLTIDIYGNFEFN